MIGTIVNTGAIIVLSLVGLLFKNNFKQKYADIILNGIGICIIFIGASNVFVGLANPTTKPLLFIVSLVIGSMIGEWIGIEKHLENFGNWMETKFKNSNSNISEGFVTGTLLYCVGTMSILGALDSAILHDHTLLYVKSILDGMTSLILAATVGIGVLFSAISVFVYQTLLTIFAGSISPLMTPEILNEISIVGGVIITGLAMNMIKIKTFRAGNMLPAIFIPVIYYSIIGLF